MTHVGNLVHLDEVSASVIMCCCSLVQYSAVDAQLYSRGQYLFSVRDNDIDCDDDVGRGRWVF